MVRFLQYSVVSCACPEAVDGYVFCDDFVVERVFDDAQGNFLAVAVDVQSVVVVVFLRFLVSWGVCFGGFDCGRCAVGL